MRITDEIWGKSAAAEHRRRQVFAWLARVGIGVPLRWGRPVSHYHQHQACVIGALMKAVGATAIEVHVRPVPRALVRTRVTVGDRMVYVAAMHRDGAIWAGGPIRYVGTVREVWDRAQRCVETNGTFETENSPWPKRLGAINGGPCAARLLSSFWR